jgi:hypothetical protein
MDVLPTEAFVAGIILVGIAVMVRIIRLQAALLLIGIILFIAYLLPSFGTGHNNIPLWLFWAVVIVLGINLIRAIFAVLFGRSAADSFTGRFLYGIFSPIIRIIEGLIRVIFRTR